MNFIKSNTDLNGYDTKASSAEHSPDRINIVDRSCSFCIFELDHTIKNWQRKSRGEKRQ